MDQDNHNHSVQATKDVDSSSPGVHFAFIEHSYQLLQQELAAVFPASEEDVDQESWDLDEDERDRRQQRREALKEKAEHVRLLYIEGLRKTGEERGEPTWRKNMLYRLATLFELATVVYPATVESLAWKLGVSYQQGVASAVLKAQAEDAYRRREQIVADLVDMDTWWHDPRRSQTPLDSHIIDFLHRPTPFSARFVQKCVDAQVD